MATTTAFGQGVLQLKLRGNSPFFITDWDDKVVLCNGDCQIVDTLVVKPGRSDYGDYSFDISSEFLESGVLVEELTRRVRMNVSPGLMKEPVFSLGSSNELCWSPFESNFNYELLRVPDSNKGSESASMLSGFSFRRETGDSCDVVEDLPEGVRMIYQLRATEPGSGSIFESELTYSTQDRTPPPAVQVKSFTIDPAANVSLKWPFFPDKISHIDKYIVLRKQLDLSVGYERIDTLSYFPVNIIKPLRFFPTKVRLNESAYVDDMDSVSAGFILQNVPSVLDDALMLKTAYSDRWNELDDFLQFELLYEADVYVAFDVYSNSWVVPKWLKSSFVAVGKSVDLGTTSLQLFKNKIPFKAGMIALGGNFAEEANFTNREPLMYMVFVKPKRQDLPYMENFEITYVDSIGKDGDQKTFKYKIITADAVGNQAEGAESVPIIVDVAGRCQPEISQWAVFNQTAPKAFSKGLTNQVSIFDPATDGGCIGFRDTDSLRFQAAREIPALFWSNDPDDLGKVFFDSGWVHRDELNPPFSFDFSFDSGNLGADFVNGKEYYYRVRSKDRHGNLSAWSAIQSATQDAYPPDDLSSISVEFSRFNSGEAGCSYLTWSGAADLVSGVEVFLIYKKNGDEQVYTVVDTIPGDQFSYCDSLTGSSANQVVSYKIGSIDNVGNERTAAMSSQEATTRVLVGPQLSFDGATLFQCPSGETRVEADSVRLSWAGFDSRNVTGYEIKIHKPNGFIEKRFLFSPALRELYCPLDVGDGLYEVRMRAFYANHDTTLYSEPLKIKRKVALSGVSNLTVIRNIDLNGSIQLSWSHPDGDEIEEFEVFSWPEGRSMPQIPTIILSGDSRSWVSDFKSDSLIAYQCRYYSIKARDCFGLVSAIGVPLATYSAKGPGFLKEKTSIGSSSITVAWKRPEPMVSQATNFETMVVIYEDNFDAEPVESITFSNGTDYTFHKANPGHNYVFRIKEVLLDDAGQTCANKFESNWSEFLTIPFDNKPAAVDFDAIPLPAYPNETLGKVFLSWQNYSDLAVEKFIVNYKDLSKTQGKVDSVSGADTLLIDQLDLNSVYQFSVRAVDSLGQSSETDLSKNVDFVPRWSFTPKISGTYPGCFRDSLLVSWGWFDENLTQTADKAGADSIYIETSIDANFKFKKSLSRLSAVRSHTLSKSDFPFVNNENNTLFLRIRGKDKWGHVSPWSNAYPQFGTEVARYDEVPPTVVSCLLDSVKAPLFGRPGVVDVYLRWNKATDVCSGTSHYTLIRNDSVTAKIEETGEEVYYFVDRNVPLDELFGATFWKVLPVDGAGNRQSVSDETSMSLVLLAPDSVWCSDDSTVCWNEAQANMPGFTPEYYLEGARFPELLGNSVTNITTILPDQSCYTFNTAWQKVYWRVKARVGVFESAWSDTFACAIAKEVVSSVSSETTPKEFALRQNYPNPFNPSTTIRYDLPAVAGKGEPVLLEIFNIMGQKVKTLVDWQQKPGVYAVLWDGKNEYGRPVSSGIYFYRIKVKGFTASYKMSLIK